VPGTYSQVLLHVVFATSRRKPIITADIQPRLYDYIGGIVRQEKGTLYAIGGMPDHIHMLLRWRTDRAIADLMRTVKARSSRWMHETFPDAQAFAWQAGYGVFAVSKSVEPSVKQYIGNQSAHHTKRDFSEEFLSLLRAHDIDFDPRYVFD